MSNDGRYDEHEEEVYQEGYDDGYAAGVEETELDVEERLYDHGEEKYRYGYDEGYEQGLDDGRGEGYESGREDGYEDAYNEGYEEGRESVEQEELDELREEARRREALAVEKAKAEAVGRIARKARDEGYEQAARELTDGIEPGSPEAAEALFEVGYAAGYAAALAERDREPELPSASLARAMKSALDAPFDKPDPFTREYQGKLDLAASGSAVLPPLSELDKDELPMARDTDARWSVLKRQIDSVLKDNRTLRQRSHRLTGVLDSRRLYVPVLGDPRAFAERRAHGGKEYEAIILVDVSGSMQSGGDGAYNLRHYAYEKPHHLRTYELHRLSKAEVAAELASVIASILLALGCKVGVLSYNHYVNWELGPGHTKPIPAYAIRNQILKRFTEGGTGCNHDAFALKTVREYLESQDNVNEQLVFLFSDGSPAADCSERAHYKYDKDGLPIAEPGDYEWAKEEYLLLERQAAGMASFGVLYDVTDCYPGSVTVSSMAEFVDGVTGALKRMVARG